MLKPKLQGGRPLRAICTFFMQYKTEIRTLGFERISVWGAPVLHTYTLYFKSSGIKTFPDVHVFGVIQ